LHERLVGVAGALHLSVIGIEDDEQDGRNAGKDRDAERDFATYEFVRRLQRMGRYDQRTVVADWLDRRIVGDITEKGLDDRARPADAAHGCGFGKNRGKTLAEIAAGIADAAEDPAGRIGKEHDSAALQLVLAEECRETRLGSLAVGCSKQRFLSGESGGCGRGHQRRGLARGIFHPAMLAHDPHNARCGNDGKKDKDQDWNGTLQHQLDARRLLCDRPDGKLSFLRSRPSKAAEAWKLEAQPSPGLGFPLHARYHRHPIPRRDSLRRRSNLT
jgi:hypothetical protein